jgi:RHS repeat-associated protein
VPRDDRALHQGPERGPTLGARTGAPASLAAGGNRRRDLPATTRRRVLPGRVSGGGPLEIPIDPNGNLTSKTEGTDTWGYEWNALNQLTRVTKNSVEQARFSYDPLGRRVEKVAGGVTASYTYDDEDVLREARGATTLKYVHGQGMDEPLASDDGAALAYFHTDALGSVVRVTDATGGVALTRQYDAWGNLQTSGAQAGYAFTGREWDSEVGLYYYRARYYEPLSGRFTSEDPIGFGGGANFYGYVGGDPVDRVDPLGLQARRRTPSPPPPPNCSQVCASALAAGMGGGGGGVVCLNNQMCPCSFGLPPNSPAPFLPGECPELDKIIIDHERKHMPEGICPDRKKLCRAEFKAPYDPTRNECEHRRASNMEMYAMAPSSSRCDAARKYFIAANERYIWDSCR